MDWSSESEHELEEVIFKWQWKWMRVEGTTPEDAKNYFDRAAGIDANMRYSLATMLMDYLEKRANETAKSRHKKATSSLQVRR